MIKNVPPKEELPEPILHLLHPLGVEMDTLVIEMIALTKFKKVERVPLIQKNTEDSVQEWLDIYSNDALFSPEYKLFEKQGVTRKAESVRKKQVHGKRERPRR